MEILNKILKTQEFKKHEKIKDFSIKIYDNSDYEGLIELYDQVFPGYMSYDLWKWKSLNNPYGEYYTVLAISKENVISAYSVAPSKISIYGDIFDCVISVDTMTDVDYRGLGLSTYIARITYEYARIRGNYFVYGFPNKISRHLIFNKLGWTFFGKRNFLTKIIQKKIEKISLNKTSYIIEEISSFDEKINFFWEKNKGNIPIIIKKDKKYLNWRFSNHPFVKYRKFLILEEDSKKISAYFILKIFKSKTGEIFGHIVDFLIGTFHKRMKEEIFKIIESFTIHEFKDKCEKISFWMPDEDLNSLATKKLGYFFIEKKKFFGFKIFRNNKKLSILNSLNNWYITMANSDVF